MRAASVHAVAHVPFRTRRAAVVPPPIDGVRIGPTAHYTAWVWYANGLSHPALATPLGGVLHAALVPMNALYARLSGRPDLDAMLLARHRVLDHLLAQAIEDGRVTQVLEIAAGLSGRGLRFARRFPALHYVETDLPDMAAHKRRLLDGAGLRRPGHDVVPLDALADAGPASVAAATAALDPTGGTAIVTEGLVGYFDRAAVCGMWRRFASALRGFPRGLYLSDLHLAGDVRGVRMAAAFQVGLSAFARGAVHLHFGSARGAAGALRAAGFRTATLHRPGNVRGAGAPRGRHVVRVIEATT